MSIERILFATDFSDTVDQAERYATDLASCTGARITVMHAVEPIAGDDPDDAISGFITKLVDESESRAAQVAARFRENGVEADTRVVIERSWKAVVDLAEEERFDLIILGNHTVADGTGARSAMRCM